MNVSMDVNQLLEQIAEKLGVAAEYVGPVVMKQAYIDGRIAMAWAIGLAVIAVICLGILVVSLARLGNCAEEDSGFYAGTFIIACIVFLALLFPLYDNGRIAINALYNPEWYAIQQILSQIK